MVLSCSTPCAVTIPLDPFDELYQRLSSRTERYEQSARDITVKLSLGVQVQCQVYQVRFVSKKLLRRPV